MDRKADIKMYKEIELYFEIRPTPHQSVRTAKGIFFQPKKIMDFKKDIAALAKKRLPADFKPWGRDVPVILLINYYFRYRKSEKKENIGAMIPKITKPDVTDNLNKAFVDALAGIVFEVDQQIYGIRAFKYWYHKDAIHAKFKTL